MTKSKRHAGAKAAPIRGRRVRTLAVWLFLLLGLGFVAFAGSGTSCTGSSSSGLGAAFAH